MPFSAFVVISLLSVNVLVANADGSGRIELLLTFFSNPQRVLSDFRTCCDDCNIFPNCETFMRFCLESVAASSASATCKFGQFETPELGDGLNISFGGYGQPLTSRTPSLINPLTFIFDGVWPKEGVTAGIEMFDKDTFTDHDLLNRADYFFTGRAGISNATTAWSSPIRRPINTVSYVVLQYRVYCADGVQCNQVQEPADLSATAIALNGTIVQRAITDSFSSRCAAPSSDQPVEWLDRNNDDIASFPSNPRVTVADGWLNVTQLEQGDRGRYTCRVVDALAPLTSFILVVTGPPEQPHISANFSMPVGPTLEIPIEDRETLSCESEGYPRPTLTWIHNGFILTQVQQGPLKVDELQSTGVHRSARSLELQATANASGNFSCLTNNGYGPGLLTTVMITRLQARPGTAMPTTNMSQTPALPTTGSMSTTDGSPHTAGSSGRLTIPVAVGAGGGGLFLLFLLIIAIVIVQRRPEKNVSHSFNTVRRTSSQQPLAEPSTTRSATSMLYSQGTPSQSREAISAFYNGGKLSETSEGRQLPDTPDDNCYETMY